MGNTHIEQKVEELKTAPESGFLATDKYPADFQATELPNVAGDGKASILGNNQAFFFAKNTNEKGEADPEKVILETGKLKELLTNVIENDTQFTLKIDADVALDPDKFAKKYENLRPEENQADREALLRREAEIITDFLKDRGVAKLITEVLKESGKEYDTADVTKLLSETFKVEGVKTDKALESAVWDVEGKFAAKQSYGKSTDRDERTWQLGTQPELSKLKEDDHKGASSILDAVEQARELETVKLTSARNVAMAQQEYREREQGRGI